MSSHPETENLPFEPPSIEELNAQLSSKYVLNDGLDCGGSGFVYLGESIEEGRPVAIKLVKADLEDDRPERFCREAKAMEGLSHPNIVDVYDLEVIFVGDRGDPFYYYAMEYVDGEDLGLMIEEDFPPERTINLMLQVCDALAYAHDSGVIHRDVKPPNILIENKGGKEKAKMVDFGLAKLTGSMADSFLTKSGTVLGTEDYVAPETLEGESPDHRADLYSVGVITYQLLTGKIPMGVFGSVVDLVPGANQKLSDAVDRALASDPNKRYQSAAEFAKDLRKAVITSERNTKLPGFWILLGVACGLVGILIFVLFQMLS